MAEFDVYQFEDQIEELLGAYQKLRKSNAALSREIEGLTRRNEEMGQRLAAVIERIRALEEEAEVQNT